MPDVRISVRVRPGSSRVRVGGSYGPEGDLVVAVHAPPVDGAANEAVRAAVAKAFGVRNWQVSIVSGQTGRSKVISLAVEPDEVALIRARLAHLLEGEAPSDAS